MVLRILRALSYQLFCEPAPDLRSLLPSPPKGLERLFRRIVL